MPAPDSVYRFLVHLYPRDFRARYADDLVQNFADLVTDRGAGKAWARTGIDLVVTVPRYRLECVMTEQHSATTINVGIALLASGGVLSLLTGLYPGGLLLVAAVVLAVVQRGTLARALRTPDSTRRRRRLGTAAFLGVVFVAATVSYMRAVAEEDVSGASLVIHNAIGVPAMVGAIVFLVVGLLTPRTSDPDRVGPIA